MKTLVGTPDPPEQPPAGYTVVQLSNTNSLTGANVMYVIPMMWAFSNGWTGATYSA